MIKAKIREIDKIVTFLCPVCNCEDVFYIRMPLKCNNCGELYSFYLPRLIESQKARKFYYLKTIR